MRPRWKQAAGQEHIKNKGKEPECCESRVFKKQIFNQNTAN